jgi:tetratricopeptide (TPR) repeat protein
MGLLTMGRVDDAAERFARFPAPGSGSARRPLAPSSMEPLEDKSAFHQSRALVLLASGEIPRALAAFDDALALDPLNAGALLGRARLRFDAGDVAGALADTQTVIDTWPRSEQPWVLRASFAERLGRPQLALTAYLAANRIWPSDAERWYKQALLLRAGGDMAGAEEAVEWARRLEPSLSLPGAGALADW